MHIKPDITISKLIFKFYKLQIKGWFKNKKPINTNKIKII